MTRGIGLGHLNIICWLPGRASHTQVHQKPRLCKMAGTSTITDTISVLRNNRKCKYIFTFPKVDSTQTYRITGIKCIDIIPWWRHQMETISALLAICAGNSPVPGEFPAQRPVTRGFDDFFDLRPDKRLSKQSWGWWFETPSHSLWRHRNEYNTCNHVCQPHLIPELSVWFRRLSYSCSWFMRVRSYHCSFIMARRPYSNTR